MSTAIDFERVFDLVAYQQKKYPQQKSLNYFLNGRWHGYSTDEIQKRADLLSCWLLEMGFEQGDKIAFVPRMGSAHWMMIDFACQQIGLIIVPMHPTASVSEMEFILKETQAKICITADSGLYFKLKPLLGILLEHLFHLEPNQEGYLQALSSNNVSKSLLNELAAKKNKILPTDTLAILYTSGTSGTPKGAMLSHHNVVSNIKSILPIFPIQEGTAVLSFLPFSHIFERTSCYAYLAFGANIYFSTSLDRVSQDFKTVRPYFCTCVPKTLEKMYSFLQEQRMDKNLFKKKLIQWAMAVGEKYKDERRKSFLFGLKLFLAKILVLNRWQKSLGGKIKYMAVGAAALRPEIGRLFSAAGVITLSGYGMTEASPFISVNRPQPGMHRFGTVGLPVPGVEIKLDELNENGEGEILVKGPNIMKGYFQRPELNHEVFTQDGWFKTGDVGKWEHKHFLTITDRKKDIFKTTAGIYIAPRPLENYFCSSPFIDQCLVIGFNKPFVCAILVPNFSLLQNWCEENAIHWTSPAFMIHNIKVVQKIQQEIDTLNERLESYKRIRKFILSDVEWTVENGDLTASFKLIRSKLLEKHHAEIEKLYK